MDIHKTSIICPNSKPVLPASLVYIQFTCADKNNTCIYCTGIFRHSDLFSCYMCKATFCTDCINVFSPRENKFPTWRHSMDICDEYCGKLKKDCHKYHMICSVACDSDFYSKYQKDRFFHRINAIDGDPTCIVDFFTEPNSFIFSKTPDDIDSYFNRSNLVQPCYTNPSYLQSIYNQNHHLLHKTETHYLCSDCYQIYASSDLLKCDECTTIVCQRCACIRYIYLETKFMHDGDWCVACEPNKKQSQEEVHALFFLCTPECIDTFNYTHKKSHKTLI